MITESDLENAARTLYDVCFKLQQNEKILIVDDSWQPKLIATLEKIAKEKGVVKRVKIRKERVDSSPIPEIKEELEKVDVVEGEIVSIFGTMDTYKDKRELLVDKILLVH